MELYEVHLRCGQRLLIEGVLKDGVISLSSAFTVDGFYDNELGGMKDHCSRLYNRPDSINVDSVNLVHHIQDPNIYRQYKAAIDSINGVLNWFIEI